MVIRAVNDRRRAPSIGCIPWGLGLYPRVAMNGVTQIFNTSLATNHGSMIYDTSLQASSMLFIEQPANLYPRQFAIKFKCLVIIRCVGFQCTVKITCDSDNFTWYDDMFRVSGAVSYIKPSQPLFATTSPFPITRGVATSSCDIPKVMTPARNASVHKYHNASPRWLPVVCSDIIADKNMIAWWPEVHCWRHSMGMT